MKLRENTVKKKIKRENKWVDKKKTMQIKYKGNLYGKWWEKILTIINGLNIHYIKKGEGKPVLILPGWGTTIDVYMAMIHSIAEYRKVYWYNG